MKYAILSAGRVAELAAEFLANGPRDVSDEATLSGQGEPVVLPDIKALAASLDSDLTVFLGSPEAADRDHFEGVAAAALHAALRGLPDLVLDDPGFWRFLALQFFWGFVHWREEGAFETGEPGRYLRYLDASNPAEAVLTRMFLRGQIANVDGDYSLSMLVSEGTDFWRSHILRVGTSYAPKVARAFIREQVERRMSTDPVLRPYARRLNRLASNVVFSYLDDDDAKAIIEELREG
jgi:hypothetical protein